jgi:hypothetical protein
MFGIVLERIKVNNSTNLILLIKKQIENNNPIIINVPNSVLFYSVMYKDTNIKRINHSFIINGYDDDKKIFYIRENTINSEVLSILTSSQPFSSYCLTYDMLEEIYNQTFFVLNNKKEIDNFLQYMAEIQKINTEQLIIKYLNYSIDYFSFHKDLLCNEIEELLNGKKYDTFYYNEQFRRTNVHSLKPVFDLIEKLLPIEYVDNFKNISNEYLIFREKVINILAKNSIRSLKINNKLFEKILLDLQLYNQKIGSFCKKIIYKDNMYNKGIKIICNDAYVTSDSEAKIGTKIFLSKNILSELKVNNNVNFWMSESKYRHHWLKIDFRKDININKIVIEHRANIKHITRTYQIWISMDDNNWKLIINIKNNKEVFNEYNFKNNIILRYFKIYIIEPNNGIDNCARLSKIDFYQ